ncbi:MAG TPA: c-type cytochrome domain-containing protein [Polyangiales bacterium]|nr:c-type cytochrome domain-containing protein [Polyangiales bacterium]
MRILRVALGCWLSLAAGACIAELEPDVGPVRAGVCKPEDSDPNHTVSYREDILPLFERPLGSAGCSCHLPSSRRTVGIDATGLDVSSYTAIMRGGNSSRDTAIVPGDPCMSLVVQKVSSAPPSGNRMPSDGPPYLSPKEIALLSDWIAEGALDN